ncbi:MAG: peptidoglycan-binding domain-containing protein [Candidatus Omnitrophica bacterium]|nr:peptidoglycan-binding domain-containing protein [Candidatus Omnitrophota bacterium]
MAKKLMWVGLAVMGIFVLNGCATMNKNDELLNQGLRNKISALETQLKEKDDEINSLKETPVKSSEDVNANISKVGEANQQIDSKQIQTALKNAGYYQGAVDGKMGKKTRKAVREFQKANNLPADGRVGKNTWLVLKEYLEKKVK